MALIRPFKAIRPKEELVSQIATHPYDVLNSAEAAELAKDNPYSYLHIDKAEIDLPTSLSPYDPQVYQQAANNLATFKERQWLIQEPEAALYLYELTMGEVSQTGLVACTSIAEYLSGKIKKHEYTRFEKEVDRINHIDSCDANTSPIFLTYRQKDKIKETIIKWQQDHQPIYDFESFYDVKHRVWLINDPATITLLAKEFESVESLYIADGHHRTESAVKVGQKRQKTYPNADSDSEFNYFLSVIFPKDELSIWDYNRVLNVPLPDNLLNQLAKFFTVTKLAEKNYKPTNSRLFGMYLDGSWYQLATNNDIQPDDVVEKLDAAILQSYVFADIFGIMDIRTDQRIDFVGGIRGIAELEKLVDSGEFTIAFSLYPTTMDQLLAVADDNQVMPPKSTWFEPKLLSGLFLHDLETPDKMR